MEQNEDLATDPGTVYPVQLTKELHRKFGPAIKRAAGSERIVWEIYPTAAPNPNQPGHIVTGICLFMSMPSAAQVGQYLSFGAIVEPTIVLATQETVDQFARERVNELLAARSQELAAVREQAAAQQAAQGNGSPVTRG